MTLDRLLRLFKKHGISARVIDFKDDILVFTATKTFFFSRGKRQHIPNP
jgi:hypothetical protein